MLEQVNGWLNLLVSTGGAVIIGALINAIMNRRKLGAEATKVITDAAAGVVERYEKDNARLRLEVADQYTQIQKLKVEVGDTKESQAEIRGENRKLRSQIREQVESIVEHVKWDDQAIKALEEHSPFVELGPPPPLKVSFRK